jgi:hypothetical protein
LEEDVKQPVFDCVLTFEENAAKYERASAVLWDDKLCISAPGFQRELRLCGISSVSAKDYRVYVNSPHGMIVLSMLGHLYEDFSRCFIKAFNEVLFNESLMKEKVHFETEGYYTSPSGETARAALRICETGVAALPETHGLVRIPFCMVETTDVQPYRFTLTDRLGRSFIFSKMGHSTDAFLLAYRKRYSELLRETREKLSGIAPADDTLAALLMEGMVQPVSAVRALSPGFAAALEQWLSGSELSKEFAYLGSLSEDLALGVKRGLMGELTGESIIVLAPVFHRNVMIMESLGDSSSATYVFRLSEDGNADPSAWPRFLLEFNDSMLSVNFRREPVYLSDEALREPRYESYAHALRRVPALARLRALFIGRAVHGGFDAWRTRIEHYMQ